jgi:uncharacterized protein (DUF2147 family)
MLRVLMASAAVWAASIVGASAGDATGVWLRESGASKVRIAPCGGDALCGAIVWLKDASGAAKVGQQVFFDMKPHGENAWTGSAFNPDDGKTYSGKMTLSGDHLTTAGCVFGGLICKSISWTRTR